MMTIRDARGNEEASLAQRAFILAAALLLCAVCIVVVLPNALRAHSGASALAMFPWDARTASESALQHLKEGTPSSRLAAAGLARSALRDDATLASSVGVLAAVASVEGRAPYASRAFKASETLSRRDLLTQISLIEDAVARNDAAGALHHYDIALRTSELAPAILYPTLMNAMSDKELVPLLADVLAGRPAWAHPFMAEAIGKAPSVDAVMQLDGEMARRHAPLVDGLHRLLLQRLVSAGRYSDAVRVAATRAPITGRLIDADFAMQRDLSPFGWSLTAETGLNADRNRDVGAGATGLQVSATLDRSGSAAEQLLVLPPGTYELVTSGSFLSVRSSDGPFWTVRCTIGTAKPFATLAAATRDRPARLLFAVPPSCPAQTISLTVQAVADPNGITGRVNFVDVRASPR